MSQYHKNKHGYTAERTFKAFLPRLPRIVDMTMMVADVEVKPSDIN